MFAALATTLIARTILARRFLAQFHMEFILERNNALIMQRIWRGYHARCILACRINAAQRIARFLLTHPLIKACLLIARAEPPASAPATIGNHLNTLAEAPVGAPAAANNERNTLDEALASVPAGLPDEAPVPPPPQPPVAYA